MTERGLPATDWRAFRGTDFPQGSWIVDGDMLRASATAERIDLVTRERFRDFVLTFDWRLPRGGNTGILYRVSEEALETWQTGPELQLIDDEHHPDGANPLTATGAFYEVLAPWHEERPTANMFHSARLVVQGSKVEHWIDDRRVLAYDLDDEELRERIAASKFKDYPQFARIEEGHIALQHHGTEAWFRNIRIEVL